MFLNTFALFIQFIKTWLTHYFGELSIDQGPIILSLERIITESQNLRAGNRLQIIYPNDMTKQNKTVVVRHLFLNELLSFLWMHMYKVQLWRHGSPKRVNIPNIGLWWDYTKTKKEFK